MKRILKLLTLPWQRFAGDVTKLPERDAWGLLEVELKEGKRRSYLKRLYEHANKLRTARQHEGLRRGTLPGDRP